MHYSIFFPFKIFKIEKKPFLCAHLVIENFRGFILRFDGIS